MRLKVALLSLLFATALQAQDCRVSVQSRAATVAALQAQLASARSPQMDPDVPQPLSPLLHSYKQALLATLDTGMLCNRPAPNRVKPDLVALLHANRPQPPEAALGKQDDLNTPETGAYGGELTVEVRPVPAHPDLLAITVSFLVECGTDNMLVLYRKLSGGAWQRALVYSNPDLNSSGDAFGDLYEWALVPGPDHQLLFAGVHGTPWCTSRMSNFKVDLLSLRSQTAEQKLLAHRDFYYSRDSDDSDGFHATADGFQLRVNADSMDFDNLFTRPRVYRFRTVGGTLERTQPFADNARDFVDSWIQLPWAEAKPWSSGAPLEDFHHRFNEQESGNYSNIVFGPVQACGSEHYQVQVTPDVPHGSGTAQTVYVHVSRAPNAFYVLDATSASNPACHGPDLMKAAPRRHR